MATIARFKAVVQMGKVSLTGFTAWVSWCFLHLLYIVGFKSQVGTLVNWFFSFLSGARSQRTTTNQQLVARLAMEQLGSGVSGKLVAGEDVVEELVHLLKTSTANLSRNPRSARKRFSCIAIMRC